MPEQEIILIYEVMMMMMITNLYGSVNNAFEVYGCANIRIERWLMLAIVSCIVVTSVYFNKTWLHSGRQ
jgi:hypothetical protein